MSESWPLIGGLCVLITKCLSPLHFRQCDAQVRRPHLKVHWHAYIKMIHLWLERVRDSIYHLRVHLKDLLVWVLAYLPKCFP